MTDELPVPAALYPLHGRYGTSDISPNNNPPGIPSDIQLAPGPYGHPKGSYQFFGRYTSYVEIPNNGGLDTTYSITVLAWMKRENDNGPIFNYGTNLWAFHLWIVDGKLFGRAVTRYNGRLLNPVSSSQPVLMSWLYVGLTYDYSSGVMKLWINGNAVDQTIAGSAKLTTNFDVRIGAKDDINDPRYFQGRICCVQVYSKALSQQEIIAVQNRIINTGGYWCNMENANEADRA